MIDEVAGDTFVARLLGSDGDEAYEIHAVYTGRGRLVPDGTFHSAGEQKEWELEDVVVNGNRDANRDTNPDIYTVVEGRQPLVRIYSDGDTDTPVKEYIISRMLDRAKSTSARRRKTKRKTKRKRARRR